MSDRWTKLAPLTGVLFAALAVAAVFANSAESPDAKASGVRVVAYYTRHRSGIETAAILFALAFLVLVLFAGALRSYLRSAAAADALGALVLAGAVLMAAGAMPASGLEYGIAHNIHTLSLQEARTLNFVNQEIFLGILGGGFIFGLSAGIAILRSVALPRWLGWLAVVIGIVTIVPPASMFALLAFLVWSVIVSVLMYQRLGGPATSALTPQPPPATVP
jgi:hypothetical protein